MGRLKGGKYISGRSIEAAIRREGWFVSPAAGNELILAFEILIDKRLKSVYENLTVRKRRIIDLESVRVAVPEAFNK